MRAAPGHEGRRLPRLDGPSFPFRCCYALFTSHRCHARPYKAVQTARLHCPCRPRCRAQATRVRSLGPVGQALLAQAPGFAGESSDAHHGPAAASVPALHPCSGRAVWPLLHEVDRYTADYRRERGSQQGQSGLCDERPHRHRIMIL